MRSQALTLAMAVLLWAAVAGAGQEIVYEPGGATTLPRVVKEVRPDYPSPDIPAEGRVIMTCVVRSDGKVSDVTVTEPLEPRLDEAAVGALKQWEFAPGTRNGKPVAVRISVEMTFRRK
jgi:TonB family protein